MNIFDLQATISLNGDAFMNGVSQAQGAFQSLGSSVGAGAVAVGTVVGNMATKAASGLIDFGTEAVQTGMSFDSAMSNVQAISGATGEEFDSLRDKAKEMGATTKFTATEAAEAFSYMAMAGWDASSMLSGIEGIMNLASASGESLATTSDIVTDALTAFGLSAEDSGHFADVLAAASAAANTNVSMMGETFKYVAPLAGTMGYTVEDMATAIGTMANSGIKGSQAGTALRSAITRLVKPTKEVTTALGALGIDGGVITDSDGNMRTFSDTIDVLRGAFSGLDEATQAEYAAMIFGQEAMSGMLAIINSSAEEYGSLAETIQGASEAMGGIGAAAEMAQTQLNNLQGDVTIFQSAFDGLKTAIYDKFKEPLREAVQTASEVFSNLTDAINNGGMAEAISSIGDMIADFATEKFGQLTDALGPVGDALEGLAGVVQNLAGAFQTAASSGIEAVSGSIQNFFDAFNDSSISSIIDDIATAAGNLFSDFLIAGESVIKGISDGIKKFFDVFDETKAVDAIESVAGLIAKLFEPFTAVLGNAIKTAASGLGDMASNLGELAGNLANGLVEKIQSLADNFEKWAPWVAAVAAGFVTMKVLGEIVPFITTLKTVFLELPSVVEMVSTAMGTLGTVMNSFGGPIGIAITAAVALTTALATAYATNEDFRNSVDAVIKAIGDGVRAAASAVASFVTETLPEAFSAFADWIWELNDKIGSFFTEELPAKFDELVNILGRVVDKMKDVGRNIVEGIKQGILGAWDSMVSWFTSQCSNLVDSVLGFFGIHSPSTVFAGIGKNLVAGMEVGWGREFGVLERQVEQDLDTLTDTTRMKFADSAIGRSSAASISSNMALYGQRGGDSVEINLVLDGDVAARALYDPLRRAEAQKGMRKEAAYA